MLANWGGGWPGPIKIINLFLQTIYTCINYLLNRTRKGEVILKKSNSVNDFPSEASEESAAGNDNSNVAAAPSNPFIPGGKTLEIFSASKVCFISENL